MQKRRNRIHTKQNYVDFKYGMFNALSHDNPRLVIAPQSPYLEIGTNFTATCMIINSTEVTADDLYWELNKTIVPKEQYTKINTSALNVTVHVTGEKPGWLYCLCKKASPYFPLNKGKLIHGIILTKGYRPGKPENVSCMAVQKERFISKAFRCEWDAVGRQTTDVPTSYILYVDVTKTMLYNVSTGENHAQVEFVDSFPDHMMLEIWVEAHNKLGKTQSEHLSRDAGSFVKTNPPSDVKVISEKSFTTSLLINWTHPIASEYVRLSYQIRYCHNGSQSWTYVPLDDTAKDIQSFRLQSLQPYTVYVVQVCCKNNKEGHGYWSNWSTNATKRTPEDRPSKPDLWRIIAEGDGINQRQVQVICKVNNHITFNTNFSDLKVRPRGGRLQLDWKPPNSTRVSEYVVEWVSGDNIDWAEGKNEKPGAPPIKGILEKFVCYNVSVYPIYSGRAGKPATRTVYLEQGAPLEAPAVRLKGKPGHNEAELVWNEIPQRSLRGFITNYTIFYSSGADAHQITVPAKTTSYTLKSLERNTKYDTCIKASTINGSTISSNHSFTTLVYAPGEMEGIVVGVSLGFLFLFVVTMLLCVYKKDAIKENIWPRIPNPLESTIGNWSPDYPLKVETPKDNGLCGVSVLDVDICDGKCMFEEDKASLALKKDKYLSEEHSSGIGGSSCMSSPRQSVSDSDEGGDMADTTASTVQYSSVVASNGYKGQTPNSQPQQAVFSRSESTQPLLDSEENPDTLLQECGRQSQRVSRGPCSSHAEGNGDIIEQQEVLEPLDFCPLEEDCEQVTPADSSYRPQLGGYRPQ
uniref:Interleukin 6 signal transducer n=1 Tax=Gasterosteus aculeatus aculeatus TaxID=481459 RepID=A0AAQ4NQM3_GASAC